MNKKILSIILVIISVSSIVSNSLAFNYRSQIPGTTSFTFRSHESLDSASQTAATTASGTWSSGGGTFSFTYGFGSTGTINLGDSRNDVFRADFDSLGWPSANAACATATQNFTGFDIGMNTDKTFGNGSGDTYVDRQGVLTHEFGHVCGLGDLYPITDIETAAKTKETMPTMYAYDSILGEKVYYYSRTLESDDITGRNTIYNSLN